MALGVTIPASKNNNGQIATLGGAILGGIIGEGSPEAIATGASLGGTAGSLLSPPPAAQAGVAEATGMENRSTALGADYIGQLRQAQAAASNLPDSQFGWAKKAYEDAIAIAEANQKMALQGGRA